MLIHARSRLVSTISCSNSSPTMDSTEVGRFGTLRLVKRLDPQTIVASFPIDDESVTFGRDPNCSVRLYYPTVSAFHAKIFFQERKVCPNLLGY